MDLSNFNYNSEHINDDDSDNESFESAMCEISNDFLFHAVIPEEEEVSFSERKRGDISPSANKGRFLAGRQLHDQAQSFASCRSTTASSIDTSYLLSVGESIDDDLSIMTDWSFDDENLSIETSKNMLSTEVSENMLSMEPSMNMLSIEPSENSYQHTGEAYVRSRTTTPKTPGLKIAKSSHERSILGQGGTKDSYNLSDLEAALISPSIRAPARECSTTLDCSDSSKNNDPSLSSLSCSAV